MAASITVRRFVALLTALGLLLSPLQPVVFAQEGGNLYLPLPKGDVAARGDVDLLYRTFVTVQTSV